ncbi:DUF4189 domain-containing protein [Altererythrobacter sp. BO-6]|uniref:DUF4189 domain-containing protein n=1 Tax=Altererythrobacter sp. BO-6 TaxID=2604537 RepID=UPI0013E11004|nr:DUF4189 domain-containing protein [Altererythrobacter sp. BO-6]QIG55073.1 DUF4189 domain-containing protein [Altererythrobacter sp. BO-6]
MHLITFHNLYITALYRSVGLALVAALATGPAQAQDREPQGLPAGAVAQHPQFIGYWVVTGLPDQQSAMDDALAQCNIATGGGCVPAFAFSAREAVIGYGADGSVMGGIGETPESARAEFDKACIERFAQLCEVENSFAVARRLALQSQEPEPRKFAAIAMDGRAVSGNGDADPRTWIATGQANWDDAVRRAMEPCEAAVGAGMCRWATTSGQTVVVFYRNAGGTSGGYRINLGVQQAIGDIDRICTQAGENCELLAINATKDEAVREYDLLAMRGVPIHPPGE